ncbi:ABC transporter ATP-binding protein [Vibrio sp. SCSIO 43136]|uniref:ABC transporter ATP-binding protein n=1 Tax=Vibrio sp. SCSIO 43136 TaxID=2819101 RepID=UPI002075C93E|nr:ABC transporter ATP-binding protein [Vibrio sp. SCSIO 43136]USD67348.1 ABC transporter ATP-binding protein [Vibrio sp. SCSIO 43136]
MDTPLVQLIQANKLFVDGKESHTVLNNLDFSINSGETIALTGASGSGKSTLLNLVAGFEPLTSGSLSLLGRNTDHWRDEEWSSFRFGQLGVVFQQFNLLTPLNVRQNIEFPLNLNRCHWDTWCDHLVDALGIGALLERHVASLSGGQQQRVAIARALAHQPKLLLADEPTGNLDEQAGLEVMQLLTEIAQQGNTSVLLVTHSPDCAAFMQAHYQLVGGKLHATD